MRNATRAAPTSRGGDWLRPGLAVVLLVAVVVALLIVLHVL
jgi:hypothetical protein